MPRADAIASLVTRLMAAACFEDAATAALEAMLGCAAGELGGGRAGSGGGRGRLLRAVVHLRPQDKDSYQQLFGIEHPGGERVRGTGYLTSGNVWRWVAEHGSSVSIDVEIGALTPWLPDGPIRRSEDRAAAGLAGAPGRETRERLLDRDASHVHVVPLRKPGGGVHGMIAIEVSCKEALGPELLWGGCCRELEMLASIAAPYLTALPPRPDRSKAVATDELLPVVGPTTAGIIELVRVFAWQDETLLISGATGSGKSRLARWCHAQSERKAGRYETLDLLSVPEELQMAELFGWKRGAFTGAVKDTPGAITRAHGGTLFIDEIDKLSRKAQAGLLRVLEERRYRPLGDESRERDANVRFLIGTNADLRAAVRAGRFREDLYYRINVLPVRLPPLGERLDELPQWAEYMLGRRHREAGAQGSARLAREAVERLLGAPWPGNLRQLDNVIRRGYALALAESLPGLSSPGGTPKSTSHDRAGNGVAELVIEARHMDRSLGYEGGPEALPLTGLLWRAASAVAQEATRRRHGGEPLSMDLLQGFRGMVLGAAVQRLESREEAFALLGQGQLVKNRNHHRALRRELGRAREFLQALGGEVDGELAAMLEGLDEPGNR